MHYQDVIKHMNLIPLPEEGGYFRETYRTPESTAIYYLVTPGSFSGLHWVEQEEIFHFYAGSAVEMFQIDPNGDSRKIVIGNKIFENESPQVVVPRGTWQGTKLINPTPGSWALLGCTVAPAFQLENFHIESREALIKRFPALRDDIVRYTNF